MKDEKSINNNLKGMEKRIEERFYVHHGRVVEKHVSIREQDDIVILNIV